MQKYTLEKFYFVFIYQKNENFLTEYMSVCFLLFPVFFIYIFTFKIVIMLFLFFITICNSLCNSLFAAYEEKLKPIVFSAFNLISDRWKMYYRNISTINFACLMS